MGEPRQPTRRALLVGLLLISAAAATPALLGSWVYDDWSMLAHQLSSRPHFCVATVVELERWALSPLLPTRQRERAGAMATAADCATGPNRRRPNP